MSEVPDRFKGLIGEYSIDYLNFAIDKDPEFKNHGDETIFRVHLTNLDIVDEYKNEKLLPYAQSLKFKDTGLGSEYETFMPKPEEVIALVPKIFNKKDSIDASNNALLKQVRELSESRKRAHDSYINSMNEQQRELQEATSFLEHTLNNSGLTAANTWKSLYETVSGADYKLQEAGEDAGLFKESVSEIFDKMGSNKIISEVKTTVDNSLRLYIGKLVLNNSKANYYLFKDAVEAETVMLNEFLNELKSGNKISFKELSKDNFHVFLQAAVAANDTKEDKLDDLACKVSSIEEKVTRKPAKKVSYEECMMTNPNPAGERLINIIAGRDNLIYDNSDKTNKMIKSLNLLDLYYASSMIKEGSEDEKNLQIRLFGKTVECVGVTDKPINNIANKINEDYKGQFHIRKFISDLEAYHVNKERSVSRDKDYTFGEHISNFKDIYKIYKELRDFKKNDLIIPRYDIAQIIRVLITPRVTTTLARDLEAIVNNDNQVIDYSAEERALPSYFKDISIENSCEKGRCPNITKTLNELFIKPKNENSKNFVIKRLRYAVKTLEALYKMDKIYLNERLLTMDWGKDSLIKLK